LRAEPLGLKIADVRHLELDQGSFELVYWHDALARILNCATEHADRWQQDQQNHNSCEEHTPDADRRRARRRPHRPQAALDDSDVDDRRHSSSS